MNISKLISKEMLLGEYNHVGNVKNLEHRMTGYTSAVALKCIYAAMIAPTSKINIKRIFNRHNSSEFAVRIMVLKKTILDLIAKLEFKHLEFVTEYELQYNIYREIKTTTKIIFDEDNCYLEIES